VTRTIWEAVHTPGEQLWKTGDQCTQFQCDMTVVESVSQALRTILEGNKGGIPPESQEPNFVGLHPRDFLQLGITVSILKTGFRQYTPNDLGWLLLS